MTMTAEEALAQFTPGRLIEGQIRAAIIARLERRWSGADHMETARGTLHQVINQAAADPLVDAAANTLEVDSPGVWEPLPAPRRWALFADLRPSEAARLMELVEAACERAEIRCVDAILEELTEAGARFLRECPAVDVRPLPADEEPA